MSGPDELAIVELVNGFVAGWNAGDAAALTRVFAEDADYVNLMGLYVHGRAVIARAYQELLAGTVKGSRLRTSIDALRFVRPDVAIVDVTFFRQDASGPPPMPLRSMVGMLVVKNRGRWEILYFRNMVPAGQAQVAAAVEQAFEKAPRS